MSLKQYVRRHVLTVLCLVIIGYGIAAAIYIGCPETIGQTHTKGRTIAFAPLLNEDGSTLHAKLGIGYRRGLLVAEAFVMLLMSWILYRVVAYHNMFFGLGQFGDSVIDFGCAAAVGRFFQHLFGFYTLDYLYIRFTHSIYDFFDLCIGVLIIGCLIWYVLYCIKYYQYKREQTKGMCFREKIKWDFRFNVEMLKAPFRPIRTWWKETGRV